MAAARSGNKNELRLSRTSLVTADRDDVRTKREVGTITPVQSPAAKLQPSALRLRKGLRAERQRSR